MEVLTREHALGRKVDEYLRTHDDATTELAEMLEGNMRTSLELAFDGQELYGRDGRSMDQIVEKSLIEAGKIVANNPNLFFELRRRHIEKDEYSEAVAIAHGELANTMVVVSDFPAELAETQTDVGGYNVNRKQAYIRVFARQPDDNLTMYSQSLDGSNRQALEALYSYFGTTPNPGELLGQRLHVQLAPEEQAVLVDRLTGMYDTSLQEQFGGNWYGGRQDEKRRNTYEFVCGQHDLVEAFIQASQLRPEKTAELKYDISATMEQRFKFRSYDDIALLQPVSAHLDYHLQQEIIRAGQEARAQGKSFSACGVTLSVESMDQLTNQNMSEAGYGNKTNEETKYNFNKHMHCVVCQAPPKQGETKKMCGPCGICKTCDSKMKSKVKAA